MVNVALQLGAVGLTVGLFIISLLLLIDDKSDVGQVFRLWSLSGDLECRLGSDSDCCHSRLVFSG